MRGISVLFLLSLALPARGDESSQSPPDEPWVMERKVIGVEAGNESRDGSILMADVVPAPGGGLRMYYNRSSRDGSEIRCAESKDGARWEAKGAVLRGAKERTARTFILGGSRVVRLPDGRFRMYYRCAPFVEEGAAPAYHLLSAISQDGLRFEPEPGVRIEIRPHDPQSPFTLAGHGAFYALEDGSWAAIFSADPANEKGPSDLYLATSPDGLVWGGFNLLYKDCHDPTVIRHGGKFHLYAMYLRDYTFHAVSEDGRTWPARAAVLDIRDARGRDLLASNAGDFCAALDPDGSVRLYCNFGTPSSAIVRLRPGK